MENELHFVFEGPLYNSFTDFIYWLIYLYLFQNVVPGSFKSFFQLDYQVDISLYLTRIIIFQYFRELVSLSSSWCTLSPITFLASRTPSPIWFHHYQNWTSIFCTMRRLKNILKRSINKSRKNLELIGVNMNLSETTPFIFKLCGLQFEIEYVFFIFIFLVENAI